MTVSVHTGWASSFVGLHVIFSLLSIYDISHMINFTRLELVKRFTPVRLQAVQSSQFHERKPKPQESVDGYAQDLRRLFHKAYPTAQQGSRETDEMGQSVGLSVKARLPSNATLVESLATYPETVQRTANWFRRSLWEANVKSTKQIGDSSGREQELQLEQDGREQQTCDTQRQERELEGTLDQVAATMHGLSATNKTQDSLGPTLTAKVQVEDVSVQALLDTGFPTTIISLDLILPPPQYKCWLQRNQRSRPQNSGRMKCDRS